MCLYFFQFKLTETNQTTKMTKTKIETEIMNYLHIQLAELQLNFQWRFTMN